ncbi:MAG TPA: GNAT family N-acetyltransferase [Ktedonobacterales bacterium]|nr:GNAT family N-acetyltransferase [Ktedonobacterales bacterium]
MAEKTRWRIKPATAADRAFLEQLAPRLTIGIPPWRSREAMLATVRGWLLENLENMGADGTVFIAEDANGMPIGAATVERSAHFTGAPQGELGELAVIEAVQGQGVAALLLAAAEDWAREQGLPYLALGTGVANSRARAFYARHGYQEEDIRLAKALRSS